MKKTLGFLIILAASIAGFSASAQSECCSSQPVVCNQEATECTSQSWNCDTTATNCNQQVFACCNLPENAQSFVTCYYNGGKIANVKYNQKKNETESEYKVRFANGQEVTFNNTGKWKEIEAPYGQCIPNGIAPDFICNYIGNNFPGSGINELERAGQGYEVGLTTGQGLMFSHNGEFVTVD